MVDVTWTKTKFHEIMIFQRGDVSFTYLDLKSWILVETVEVLFNISPWWHAFDDTFFFYIYAELFLLGCEITNDWF